LDRSEADLGLTPGHLQTDPPPGRDPLGPTMVEKVVVTDPPQSDLCDGRSCVKVGAS
jgi:hypothetical protein